MVNGITYPYIKLQIGKGFCGFFCFMFLGKEFKEEIMNRIITLWLILVVSKSFGQSPEPVQIEWNGKMYWRYESVINESYNGPFNYDYGIEMIREFPKDGDWISFYEDDSSKVASVFKVKRGFLDGFSVQYYLNGQKLSEYEFLSGVENGCTRHWSREGVLTYTGCFVIDSSMQYSHMEGEFMSWDSEGNLMYCTNYKGDRLHGKQMSFYKNGQVKEEVVFVEGEKDSIFTMYYPNGQIFKQLEYRRGVFVDSVYKEFYPNGILSGEGQKVDNMRYGKWVFYYEDGEKFAEGEYVIDVLLGHHTGDYDLFASKRGEWKYWYPNGYLKFIATYTNESRKEDWQFFNEFGRSIPFEEFIDSGAVIDDFYYFPGIFKDNSVWE